MNSGRWLVREHRFVCADERIVDCGRRDSREDLHTLDVDEVAVRLVINEGPGALVTVDNHQHAREPDTEEGNRNDLL
ncbi:unnamed protein product [Dibothriocephalus latus]|uniref:Uncharacterized protein n=1 Tax=Dibothriocephalus latus TaxID=60516 RepID=A0A3P7MVL5_DIBLA|nr:unnamed protein product [Dibothriocephalus latus]